MNPSHDSRCRRVAPVFSRRDWLAKCGGGFGTLALNYLLEQDARGSVNPLTAKTPVLPARAKNVIFLFMEGGPSHVDTFDPKPELTRFDGKPLPPSFQAADLHLQFIQAGQAKLMGAQRKFSKRGQSGLEISDLFENTARFADDMAVVRSCYHDSFIHGPALRLLHTGSIRVAFPRLRVSRRLATAGRIST